MIQPVLLLGELHAASARANHHAHLAKLLSRHGGRIDSGRTEGLTGRRDRQQRHAGNMGTLLQE